jgi:hypothetical protein
MLECRAMLLRFGSAYLTSTGAFLLAEAIDKARVEASSHSSTSDVSGSSRAI